MSCAAPLLSKPRASDTRSRISAIQTLQVLAKNHGRRYHGRLRRYHASQFAKKQDMARLFLNDGLESLDECLGEVTRRARRLKETKREEAVDAFAVAGKHPRPQRVGGRRIRRLGRERDAVRLDQLREHDLVARFLIGVHRDGFAQKRIFARRVRRNTDRRAAFRLHRDVPDRQRRHALQRRGIELRPVDDGGLVRVVRGEQQLAEHPLVLSGTCLDLSGGTIRPVTHRMIRFGWRERVGHVMFGSARNADSGIRGANTLACVIFAASLGPRPLSVVRGRSAGRRQRYTGPTPCVSSATA
jgi:hypothetical protein